MLRLVVLVVLTTLVSVIQATGKVTCSDGLKTCPAATTCCVKSAGGYGCCPLPNANCCADHIHCCPSDYNCNLKTSECEKGTDRIPLLKKIEATPLPHFEELKAITSPVTKSCPGEALICRQNDTCCKGGCCPYSNATCCPNNRCCPSGFTCDNTHDICMKGPEMEPMAKVESEIEQHMEDTVCPDKKSSCPPSTTCCAVPTGDYECCPLKLANCCRDKIHCCPHDMSCNLKEGVCHKNGVKIPFLTKKKSNKIEKVEAVICPDSKSQCPARTTCCKTPNGEYSCCPLPKAECCSDQIHCCPEGTTCDLSEGVCHRQRMKIALFKKISSTKISEKKKNKKSKKSKNADIICPGGKSKCPARASCCETTWGEFECCPLKKAKCCDDKVHCCPHDMNCDYKQGVCTKDSIKIPILKKTKSTPVKDAMIKCGDGKTECATGSTCCQLADLTYGCCPYAQGVCCKDHASCCPHAMACDLESQTCTPEVVTNVPWLHYIGDASVMMHRSENVKCDSTTYCPKDTTCCGEQDDFHCCPLPKAVCCSDMEHCCPEGTTCNLATQMCLSSASGLPLKKWKSKIAKVKAAYFLKPAIVSTDTGNKMCPGGKSQCFPDQTCCKLSTGVFGCCPMEMATCCADGLHCCPDGYTCDLTTSTCKSSANHISISWSQLLIKRQAVAAATDGAGITAKKMKKNKRNNKYVNAHNIQCPSQNTECPSDTTCCQILKTKQYGCCPKKNAVCCSDGIHCCPKGSTCDKGKCTSSYMKKLTWAN